MEGCFIKACTMRYNVTSITRHRITRQLSKTLKTQCSVPESALHWIHICQGSLRPVLGFLRHTPVGSLGCVFDRGSTPMALEKVALFPFPGGTHRLCRLSPGGRTDAADRRSRVGSEAPSSGGHPPTTAKRMY